MICTFSTLQSITYLKLLPPSVYPSYIRVDKKNGQREPRYVVEIPIDDGADAVANVKQILVSPKNIIHLPGEKPSVSVPVLNQRLIFTGSMKSIIKVLNQDVPLRKPNVWLGAFMKSEYNLLTAEDKLTSEASAMVSMAAVGRNIRGIPPEIEQRGCEILNMGKLWKKIKLRSYKSRAEDTTAKGDDTEEGDNHLPPSYQSLQSTCPSMGRIHKICFNPKCYKIVQNPTSKQSKMKRCRKCNAVAYCDRDCALEAWDHHRKVCKVIQNDNVKFADYITLSSPKREEVMSTQRMVRLCVNRIASLEDSDGHFQNKQSTDAADDAPNNSNNNNTAKLVYDVMTQLGPDITNKILMMVENPPPPNREATVAVAFNSLGSDLVYSNEDIQLFANVHDCSVTYQQQQVAKKDDEDEVVEAEDGKKGTAYTDVVALEPNGELPGGGSIRGNVGSVIGDMGTDGYNSFLNSMNNAQAYWAIPVVGGVAQLNAAGDDENENKCIALIPTCIGNEEATSCLSLCQYLIGTNSRMSNQKN